MDVVELDCKYSVEDFVIAF